MSWNRVLRRTLPLAGFAGASLAVSLLLFGGGSTLPASHAAVGSASGENLAALPLGDGHTSTTTPQANYLYECRVLAGGGGAFTNGPWIHGSTYDLSQKVAVSGAVSWPGTFSARLKGKRVVLSGNGLPKRNTTGVYPIQASDPAYQYDRNPNHISSHTVSLSLSARPSYHSSPACVGGQVGIITNGVALFSAVDGENRDAVAHEVQDSCNGHPEMTGVYHYHGLPSCIDTGKPNQQSKLIGWALDGFPIYGPRGKGGRYLSNSNLDECHGTTSKVTYFGKKVRMYHYVANYEFPYTVGCYRGTPSSAAYGPPQ